MDQQGSGAASQGFSGAVEILEREARSHKRVAAIASIVGVAGLAVAAFVGWRATANGATVLASAEEYRLEALIFELVRTTAAAALLAAFVWGTLNIARAALDQSTRYEKRLVAGHFLFEVLNKFEDNVKQQHVELDDVMEVFAVWNASVDSAYTHVKYGSKKGQDLSIAVSKDGVALATGGGKLASTLPSDQGDASRGAKARQ